MRQPRQDQRNQGFTLVEVLIAATVIVVSMVALAGVSGNMATFSQEVDEKLERNLEALRAMEHMTTHLKYAASVQRIDFGGPANVALRARVPRVATLPNFSPHQVDEASAEIREVQYLFDNAAATITFDDDTSAAGPILTIASGVEECGFFIRQIDGTEVPSLDDTTGPGYVRIALQMRPPASLAGTDDQGKYFYRTFVAPRFIPQLP